MKKIFTIFLMVLAVTNFCFADCTRSYSGGKSFASSPCKAKTSPCHQKSSGNPNCCSLHFQYNAETSVDFQKGFPSKSFTIVLFPFSARKEVSNYIWDNDFPAFVFSFSPPLIPIKTIRLLI